MNSSLETDKIMKSSESLSSMRVNYELNVEKIFEKRLMLLEKNGKKIRLNEIRLNIMNDQGGAMSIQLPIERIKISKDKVYCESMLIESQFSGQDGSEIYLESVNIMSDNNTIAASLITDEAKVDINFEKLQTPILLFSACFTTKYPKAISRIMPTDSKDAFIYALYDENDMSKRVIFYTGKNFTGDSYVYKIGDSYNFFYDSETRNPLNDAFKSVKVGSKCKLYTWGSGTYSKEKVIFLEDSADMKLSHNGLSSFVITHKGHKGMYGE